LPGPTRTIGRGWRANAEKFFFFFRIRLQKSWEYREATYGRIGARRAPRARRSPSTRPLHYRTSRHTRWLTTGRNAHAAPPAVGRPPRVDPSLVTSTREPCSGRHAGRRLRAGDSFVAFRHTRPPRARRGSRHVCTSCSFSLPTEGINREHAGNSLLRFTKRVRKAKLEQNRSTSSKAADIIRRSEGTKTEIAR
jgi:hypothetical protein